MTNHLRAYSKDKLILIIIASISIIVVGVWPLFVGMLAESMKFTIAQQGWIISSESFGMVTGTALAICLSKSRHARRFILISAVIMLLFNTLTVGVESLAMILVFRFLTGLGAGTAYSLAVYHLGRMQDADRSFGLTLALQTAVFCAFAVVYPHIVSGLGQDAAIHAIGAWFILLFVCSMFMSKKLAEPNNNNFHTESNDSDVCKTKNAAVIGLVGMTCLQLAIYAVWGFISNIGTAQGVSDADIGLAFGIGLIGGFPGAVLASVMGARYGRVPFIFLGSMMVLASIAMLANGPDSLASLAFAIFVMNVGWMLALSYYMGLVAANDRTGVPTSLIGIIQITGVTLAPALVALATTGNDLTPIFTIAFISCLVSAFLPLAIRKNKLVARSA